MQMQITSKDIFFICGTKLKGKSYFVKNFLLEHIPAYIIWDYNHEYGRYGIATNKLEDLKPIIQKHHKAVYQPYPDKSAEHFNEFCGYVFHHFRNLFVVIDESHHYIDSYSIPDNAKLLVNSGRHKNLGLVFISRLPKTYKAVVANADHIIIFKQTRPQELDYLADWVGEKVYKLKDAPPYFFCYYNQMETRICEPI